MMKYKLRCKNSYYNQQHMHIRKGGNSVTCQTKKQKRKEGCQFASISCWSIGGMLQVTAVLRQANKLRATNVGDTSWKALRQ